MISVYGYTDKGDREINEDAYIVLNDDKYVCCVLCDGLGGHGRGEVASAMVTEVFKTRFNAGIESPADFIEETLQIAQNMLMSEQAAQKAFDEMKTTATVVLVDKEKIYRGYIGDSRIYTFHSNRSWERTLDHSVPQMLVLAKDIKEKKIRNHPDRNRLLKVMGIKWDKPQYHIEDVVEAKKCKALLLCSDGFWEFIDEKNMRRLLRKSVSVECWVNAMKDIAQKNGKGKNMDNNTAIGIWIEG